ncbi:GNAT family N-acetyltransferase [Hyunsoonleella pacifica]|uniref:GNAT family N-acetyltransferase n=1 Tax=Hyunsoonleella pacifica TaxID=1080224 RepID=A0A4Q9FQD0_9FLAO|nr:GNAT family N-acetyltransferase [Hyunsoonleella pacifica]TBN17651.1 GNAT family N-acetyltransferase [Hyunsoonleella pacifica]GGD10129.1 hypothetical protein GCM10011368_10110 [Hyunsoonleella pacifica]
MQLKKDVYKFECIEVKNKTHVANYKAHLREINGVNIFYSYEYINAVIQNNFMYATLKKKHETIALMPIYLKKINDYDLCDSNNTDFFDASSPYGYGGPIFNPTNSAEEISLFWHYLDSWYSKNNIITEFIRFNLFGNHKHYSGHLVPTLNNVKGTLFDFETLWNNFKQKVRNNYRKSLKFNLKSKIYAKNIDTDVLEKFHDIYIKSLNRNKAALNYYYSKTYFEDLINNNPNDTILVLIFKEDIAISAELILIDGNTLYSHLGGTHSEYFNMRPNDFLKIEVMKWAIENNKKYYVLGGGRSNNDGLYQYKKSFFPLDKDIVFYTGRKVINQPIYNNLIKNIKVEFTDAMDDVKNSEKYFPLYGQKKIIAKKLNIKTEELRIISTKKEWKDAIKSVGHYDFYHTYDYHTLSKLEDETPLLIEYTEDNKKIYLPLIKRKIPNTEYFDATSVYGYAGPLQININSAFDNSIFVKKLNEFFEKEKIVSVFSRLNPFIDYQELILKGIGKIEELSNVVNIDLTKNVDEQRTTFSKTTKRYINKCRKTFDFRLSNSKEDILKFIDLYYENMDRVNAEDKYYFSKQYFFDFIKSDDYKTSVLLAIDKEREDIISAAMMVKTNNIIQYHISGTRNEYLNISPIRLLIDEMRLKGTEEGFKYFNLGGGLGNQEDELFRFKASFSKDFKPFKIWKHITNEKTYKELVTKNKTGDLDSSFFPLYRL